MWIGQDEEVARHAHMYNLAFLPAVFFFGIRDCTRKFLAAVNRNTVAMVMILLGVFL